MKRARVKKGRAAGAAVAAMEAAGVATGAVAAITDDELGIARVSYFCVPLIAAFPASFITADCHWFPESPANAGFGLGG